jgi:hypothetical protein
MVSRLTLSARVGAGALAGGAGTVVTAPVTAAGSAGIRTVSGDGGIVAAAGGTAS